MLKIKKLLQNTWVLLTIVLVFAALFRLPLLQFAEFKGDEALNLFLATRPIFHHPFPPASQASSAGILNFPLLNYLLFPIVLFTLYPPTISLVIAVINIVTVGLFFLLFSKYHGKLTGFLASTILALSPWMILYSRKIWAQDFLLPLTFPFFWSVYKILEGKREFWILFGASSMLLMQIHQLAILLPLTIFISYIAKKQSVNWRLLLLGIFLGLIPTIPYFVYMSSGFFHIESSSTFADRFSFHSFTTFLRPLQIISLGDFHRELGDDFALFAQKFSIIYRLMKLSYIAYILLPLGAFFFWKDNRYKFFIVVAVSIIALYFLIGVEPLMHYFIFLSPLFALFTAFALATLFKKKRYAYLALLTTALYFASLFLFNVAFLAFLSEKGGFSGEYGSGYLTSEVSAQHDLPMFRNDPMYNEIKIMYFAPQKYFQGFLPVGQMIFPKSSLVKNEREREKAFLLNPNNPITATEVMAYYTNSANPSWDYVVSLKKKTLEHSEYSFIYRYVLDNYLERNLKHIHETADYVLLFPRHWKEQNDGENTTLTDEDVSVIIKKEPEQTSSSIMLHGKFYTFSVESARNDEKTKAYAQETFKDILSSVRSL